MQAHKIATILTGLSFAGVASAYTPQASADKYGLFLGSSSYSIPSSFWQNDGNSNNRILKPSNGSGRIENHHLGMRQFKHTEILPIHRLIILQKIKNFSDILQSTNIVMPSILQAGTKLMPILKISVYHLQKWWHEILPVQAIALLDKELWTKSIQ